MGTTPKRAGLFRGGGRSVVPVDGTVRKDAVVAVTLERAGGRRRADDAAARRIRAGLAPLLRGQRWRANQLCPAPA